MDEDQILQSIIADPDLVDPNIDVSKLRQTTETNPRLLAEVPEFSGLQFDPSKGSYIEDLYSIYSGGLPQSEILQDPTTMIPQTPVIDTSIDVDGGGGGGNNIITPDTTIRDELIDEGIQAAEDDKGDMMLDEGVPVGEAYPPIDILSFDDQYQEIEDIPITKLDQGVPVGEAYPPIDTVNYSELDDLEADIGTQTIEGLNTEQQGLIDQAFSKVGSTASDIMNNLSQLPGAVVDFANQTVDVFGKKINVGATLLKAGINKIVGGPISLVFDALSTILPEDSIENRTTRSVVDELKAENDYGFNMQSGNLNQDPFGRNPVSALGNYEQTLMNDLNYEGDNKFNNAKKDFAQDYFDKKAEFAGGVEVDEGTVLGPGEAPGEDLVTAEIEAGIAAADEEPAPSGDEPQGVDAGTADIQDFADVYDPPAPAPAPAPNYGPYSSGSGNGGGSGGTSIGGGQQTSSGGPGGFSSGSGGWGWAKGGIVSLKNGKR